MKIALDAAKQLRAKAAQLLEVAGVLETLDMYASDRYPARMAKRTVDIAAMASRPKHKRRLSPQGLRAIRVAQKKRWAKVRGKR